MEQEIQKKNIRAVAGGMLLILLLGVFFIGKSLWPEGDSASEDGGNLTSSETTKENEITNKDLYQMMIRDEKVELIDIRNPDDFLKKRLHKSRPYPGEALNALTVAKETPVVIIFDDLTKDASLAAFEKLREKDMSVKVLKGGIELWETSGYPMYHLGDPRDFIDQSKVTYITRDEVLPEQTNNPSVVIVDIQKKESFDKKHIKDAIHIPLDELEKRAKAEIPAGKTIIIYGENELESFRGGVQLFDLNFFSVLTLRGNDHLKPGSPLPLAP